MTCLIISTNGRMIANPERFKSKENNVIAVVITAAMGIARFIKLSKK
jgi:hypothetical protein